MNRTKNLLRLIILVASMQVVAQTVFAESYSFTSIDVPGFKGKTAVSGINNWRHIVGHIDVPSPAAIPTHGFLRVGETFIPIDVPGARATHVSGINNSGQMVGGWTDANGVRHGFLLSGTFSTIDFPGNPELTDLAKINDRGEIIGTTSPRFPEMFDFHPFILSRGSFITVDSILPNLPVPGVGQKNNWGEMVGSYRDTNGEFVGFVIRDGQFETIRFPGASRTEAQGINNLGQVIGSYVDIPLTFPLPEEPQDRGFLLSEGKFITIEFPGARNTVPRGINDWSEIVGYYDDGTGRHGFLAKPIK